MAAKKRNETGKVGGMTGRAALYTLALIAAALLVLVVSAMLIPGLEAGPRPPPGGVGFSFDADNFFLLRAAFSVLNLALVIYLLFIYVRNYVRIKSSFTLGLATFIFSLLLYALSTFPAVHMALGPYSRSAFLSFVPMLFTAISLLILAKLSNE